MPTPAPRHTPKKKPSIEEKTFYSKEKNKNGEPMGLARWPAVTSFRTGSTSAQTGMAKEQRLWNRQPKGIARGLGTSRTGCSPPVGYQGGESCGKEPLGVRVMGITSDA